jgi:predicted amidohydrolase YtcJ
MKAILLLLLLSALVMTAQTLPTRPSRPSRESVGTRLPTEGPDTIFINGDIYTGAELGFAGAPAKLYPRAQAIAVRGDRIVAVGSAADIQAMKAANTRVVDLGERFVMPGFNDAHLHLSSGGFEHLNVELAGTKSLQEMQQRIADRVRNAAPGEWILGRGWDESKWTVQKLPARQDLDAVTQEHPAIFSRADGHMSVANTAALKAAGITKSTPNPPGGKIDRDAAGEATGILREGAAGLVSSKEPAPTSEQRRRAIELALQDAAMYGVTSMQDNSSWEDYLTYIDLEGQGKLTARISEWLMFNTPLDVLEQHRAYHPAVDPMLHTTMLKAYMDGSLGSHTAALLQPYADEPSNKGLPQYDQAKLNQMAEQRAAAGFQMGYHAIGDGGVEMALKAFADAQTYAQQHAAENPHVKANDFRNRVEHAQVTTAEQIQRFHALGVIASMQPCHLLTDMNWAVTRIGPERAKTSYAWKQFLDNSVVLAFGTDYPVEPITPFRGLYAAITRKNEAGTKEYYPEQKIGIDQAIAAYTTGAAFAEVAEHDKGRLAPGFLADFVVLDRDITKAAPADVLKTRVLRTVVGGKTVYETK